ncbi:MAG: LamG domain-containing protein [Planctomycetota bacterium]|jgi:hypothetical protein
MSRLGIGVVFLLLTAVAGQAQDYALSFAGPGRFVRVEGMKLPAELRALTVELRYRVMGKNRQQVPVVSRWARRSGADDPGTFELAYGSTGKWVFRIRDIDGNVQTIVSGRQKPDDGWHHVAARWDGMTLSILVDGAESARKEVAKFGALYVSQRHLVIGVEPGKARRPPFFDGLVSDVAVWSVARPVEEVTKPVTGRARNRVAFLELRASAPTGQLTRRLPFTLRATLSEPLARSGWSSSRFDLTHHSFDGTVAWKDRKLLVRDARRVGVMWQRGADRSVHVAWFDPATGAQETVSLRCGKDEHLVTGAADAEANLYYLVVQALPFKRPRDQAVRATLHKASPKGEPLLHRELDTRPNALNVWSYNPSDLGSMQVSRGIVGAIFPHRMYKGGDGLRHQRAIAVTFSAKTLEVVSNLGQTSGHSKGSVLGLDAKGNFFGLDLGDNYPRGLHLHRFDARGRLSRVVYTYKTRHGTSPFRGSPRYDKISTGKTAFYKWSNDNGTYSRLGAVIEGPKSYHVVFSTARSPEGKVLDNSRAFPGCKDPWDLALLRIVKDFGKARGGSFVSDAILADKKKDNVSEEGGFFDFGGRWKRQRVTGVNWLTSYGTGEYALAPLASGTPDGGLVILWEKSVADKREVYVMRFDKKDRLVRAPTLLRKNLRLNPEDRLVRIGERVYFLAGDTRESLRMRLFSYRPRTP